MLLIKYFDEDMTEEVEREVARAVAGGPGDVELSFRTGRNRVDLDLIMKTRECESQLWVVEGCEIESVPKGELVIVSTNASNNVNEYVRRFVRARLPRSVLEPWFECVDEFCSGLEDKTEITDSHMYATATWGPMDGECRFETVNESRNSSGDSPMDLINLADGRSIICTLVCKLAIAYGYRCAYVGSPFGSYRITVEIEHVYVTGFGDSNEK